MDIHKPKPWHGFREFLKEYVIIVVGVLTALGGEQLVETLHWRHETGVAREALAFDFRRIVGQAAQIDGYSPCLAERLGGFSDALDQAQTTKRLPPIGWGGHSIAPPWTMRSWYGLTSGQTLAHMSNRDQTTLSAITGYLEWLRALRTSERDAWAVLETTRGPGRPISDAEIANLRAELGRARLYAVDQRSLGRQLETVILRSGFLSRTQVDDAYKEGLAKGRQAAPCQPPRPPAASSRDEMIRDLTGPPVLPGETPVPGVGVRGAFTTDR